MKFAKIRLYTNNTMIQSSSPLVRLIASDNGVVIAASMWGKYKTTFQMIMVILMIVNLPQLQLVTDIVMWIATILTVVSLIDYLVKNKQVIGHDF